MTDYKDEVKINRYDLDKEWEYQAVKFSEWAEKAAEADYWKDLLKDALEVIEAELAKQIRTDPEGFGVSKITDKSVQELIVLHPKRQEAKKKYLEAVKDAKILSVAEKSFEHKKKALEKLTDLYLYGFIGKSSYSGNNSVKEYLDRVQESKQLEALNKNPRLNRRE